MKTRTFDLEELLESKRNDLADVEETIDDLVEEIDEKYGSHVDVPAEVEQKYENLESGRVELQGEVDALEDIVDEHDDTSFVIKQLSGGEVAHIQDEVSEQSFTYDVQTQSAQGVPKVGHAEILWTRRAVTRCPDWVPDSDVRGNDPANIRPWKVFRMLSDAVNNFNTTGDFELGNLSLRERMASTHSSQKQSTEESTPTT